MVHPPASGPGTREKEMMSESNPSFLICRSEQNKVVNGECRQIGWLDVLWEVCENVHKGLYRFH